LGTIRNLVDSTESIVNTYDYKAYGNIRNQTGTTPNPYLFTGRRWSETTKDYYYRARHYMPEVGLFGAVDRYAPGEMTYGYAGGNPIMFKDPRGEERNTESNSVLILLLHSSWDQYSSSTSADKYTKIFKPDSDKHDKYKWNIKVLDWSDECIDIEKITNTIKGFDPDFLFIVGHGGNPHTNKSGQPNINWKEWFKDPNILDAKAIEKMKEANTIESTDDDDDDVFWPEEVFCLSCYSAYNDTLPKAFGGDFLGFLGDVTPSLIHVYISALLEAIANGATLKEASDAIPHPQGHKAGAEQPKLYRNGEQDDINDY
jgi:RHS repeat-associated protein